VNTFALEIFDDQGQVCTFYTVRWEDATLSETDKFFQKFRYDEQLKNSLRELASFLEVVIGDEHGALEYFFRFENAAQALPPSGTYKVQDVFIYYGNFPLRLYCLRISENLVVLFNGAEKTAATAQGGRTSMAFQEANIFAKRMLDALQQKEIYITTDQRAFRYYDGSNEIII
jgi:DNA-binding protein